VKWGGLVHRGSKVGGDTTVNRLVYRSDYVFFELLGSQVVDCC
jgi:hypothetical protein